MWAISKVPGVLSVTGYRCAQDLVRTAAHLVRYHGACAVSLSTSYAFGDVFKANHSLHRKLSEAKFFYGTYAGLVVLAGAIVLIPNAPLGLLVMLSLILATVTIFPSINATSLAAVLGIILVASLLVMGVVALVQRHRRGPDPELVALARMGKETWRMPPLAELTRPVWSTTRKIGMFTLRAYLLIAVILLVVKVIQLAIGH